MPHVVTDDGIAVYPPGVISSTRVASSLPGPLPQFHVPILLGAGSNGHPYNADSLAVANETPFTPFRRVAVESDAAAYFGENSDIHVAMKFAKRHGLPFCYVANLSALTRAAIIADTVTTNVEQFTLFARKFGPAHNWAKITFSAGILTLIPVKRYALLAADLGSAATRVTFQRGYDWLTVGAAITIGSNAVAGVARTILATGVEIGATGQRTYWAELSSAVGSGCTTAQYAMVLQYDTDRTLIAPTTFTTSQAMIDFFNTTLTAGYVAVKHANFTDAIPATISSATPLKEITAWGTVTKGVSPAPTGSDVDAFIALMNGGELDAFKLREQLVPQTYLLVDSSATNHGKLRDYATAERTRIYGDPISVTAGCAWGDTVVGAGNSTDPTFRAASLNSQDVQLAAGGLDREGAYVSLAPALWARRCAGGPGHNQTNDELVFSELEKKWNNITLGELDALCKKGVATYKLSAGSSGFRFKVCQGLTTLQANNGLIWNVSDATTWSTMQRDLADFVELVLREDFEDQIIGADRVDANAIAAVLQRRAERSLVARGFIKPGGFTITLLALNDAGNGYDLQWSIRLPDTVDYLSFRTTILVGE